MDRTTHMRTYQDKLHNFTLQHIHDHKAGKVRFVQFGLAEWCLATSRATR
jgi:hypothetical protein